MIRLAQSRMVPPLERRFDAEDVAQSACKSFFVSLRDDRYDFGESRDVWRLLSAITINKLRHKIRHVSAGKCDIAKEESTSTSGNTLGLPIGAICREPTPEDIVICSETLTQELTPFSELKRKIISKNLRSHGAETLRPPSRNSCRPPILPPCQAFDLRLNREVAIKVPRQTYLSQTEADRFVNEATVAACLRHPHIVEVHEAGQHGNKLFIVQEYVHGVPLDKWLLKNRPDMRAAARWCQPRSTRSGNDLSGLFGKGSQAALRHGERSRRLHAVVRFELKEYPKAIDDLSAAIILAEASDDKSLAALCHFRGRANLIIGSWVSANTDFERFIDLVEQEAESLGDFKLRLEEYQDKGIKHLQDAFSLAESKGEASVQHFRRIVKRDRALAPLKALWEYGVIKKRYEKLTNKK